MFGGHFYHKRVRTAVSVFGSLFNNLNIIRTNASNQVISQVKVPLSYAKRRDFLSRISDMGTGESEYKLAIKLPRMSFEITSMSYDPTRQLPKINTMSKAIQNSVISRQRLYSATPYTIGFQLNVYAKNQDDALQVVEQILPYFVPQYTVTVKPFADIPTLLEDVPISLSSVSVSDEQSPALGSQRTIIYTLAFNMDILLHGPLADDGQKIIRDVRTNYFLKESGMKDSDEYISTVKITPNPNSVSVDSDFGFTLTYMDSDGL
jgi:hypothetical protein